jgi:hypothetical protein
MSCPRCGLESSRDRWQDGHPAAAVCAAVFFGLPALYTIVGVLLAYPWFFVPLVVVALAFVAIVDRRQRQRHAIAARADDAYGRQIAKAVFAPRKLPPVRHRRPADHWSATEPMRTGRN